VAIEDDQIERSGDEAMQCAQSAEFRDLDALAKKHSFVFEWRGVGVSIVTIFK
jgi:hypothetical protein